MNLAAPILTAPSDNEYNMSLSPAAQAVFNNTQVEYTPLSPNSPARRSQNGDRIRGASKQKSPVQAKPKKVSKPTTPIAQHQAINYQAQMQNDTIDPSMLMMNPNPPRIPTPRASPPAVEPLPPSNATANISVIVPEASINKGLYEPFVEEPVFDPQPILPPPKKKKSFVDAQPETAPPKLVPSILLPQANQVINKADYEVFTESPQKLEKLSGKKRRSFGDDDAVYGAFGEREKAEQAFSNLQSYMLDIFEAEDQLNPGQPATGDFFVDYDGIAMLNGSVHSKVELLLQKIITHGRFSQVPLDDLLRLQKLCEPSVKYADKEELKVDIDGTWQETDVEVWLQHMNIAEVGLKAARTSLRIMTGGREERQIYSEETIQTALDGLKTIVDGIVVPIVELRSSGQTSGLFKLLSVQKRAIGAIMNQCRRLLSIMNDLAGKIELSETVITTLEYMVSRLVFVENAHTEKDSLLGTQKFDAFRVVAMDVLAQIFSSRPNQRQGIFDDILTSLEKLPATKQSARQFKLADGGSIQLVSALIMRLIQTSACDTGEETKMSAALTDTDADEETDEARKAAIHMPSGGSSTLPDPNDTERRAAQDPLTAVQALNVRCTSLMDKAKQNAQYVVTFIINRAMGSTKSGDSPYRNLLDLFAQDFITCLNSTDWPAAELLLRYVLFKMITLAENDKTPAPAKNMALDVLGEMGAAISQLNSQIRSTVSKLETTDEDVELARHLARLADVILDGKGGDVMADMITWTGPFRMSLEFLDKRSSGDRAIQSAVGYRTVEWASQICSSYDLLNDDNSNEQTEQEYGRLAYRTRMMIHDRKWLSSEYTFKSVATAHARLAYSLTILGSEFCRLFDRIVMNLLNAMSSDQATVRSKSLKSVNQVLETDPTILDRETMVMKLILRCASDSSVQVRDSALGLIGKCINLRPAIEEMTIPEILQRVSDTGVGVRKRAIRLLKDIYLRNEKEEVRSAIADAFLHRVTDLDDGVQELARNTIEEVWLAPFYLPKSVEDNSPQYRLRVTDHVRLMAKTINRTSNASSVLDKVLSKMLSADAKLETANRRVCTTFVAIMFDSIVDSTAQGAGAQLEYRDSLDLLMIFAKADARLFTVDQVQLLEPYSTNLKTKEDLLVFRAVVVIWRHVFPQLSSAHSKFLQTVRGTLLSSVQKLSKGLMDDVIACLWIISGALENKRHLSALTRSALLGMQKLKRMDLSAPNSAEKAKLAKLALIVGLVGKHCDLDSEIDFFKEGFTTFKGTSIAKLIVDIVISFASSSQPLDVRLSALDAVGMVCQSWPRNFSSVNVYTNFQAAFEARLVPLETVILKSFNEFLRLEEKRAEPATDIPVGASIEIKATLGVMGGTAHDGVSLEIAHKFLEDITRIALGAQDEHAILATEILCSINRQGLNHPKECGPALVALETSQNKTIADMAFREHRALHEKHETIMEKEYMRAIQAAYNYQRDVVEDTHGAHKDTSVSKLAPLLDVLKISKPKSRKRFFEGLCARIDFDSSKLDAGGDPPVHVDFSRFIVENLAFFEYTTIDDLMVAISAMEKVVSGTGSTVAHAIETEIFRVNIQDNMQSIDQLMVDGEMITPSIEHEIDIKRLRQLTAGTMILAGLWEVRTFLRRSYGLLHHSKKDAKSKSKDKDTSKAPVKVQGITSEKLWIEFGRIETSLNTIQSMKEQCRSFVELLNVDKDFKLAVEGDDDAAAHARLTTPSDDEGEASGPPGGSGRGRKRKGSSTPGGRKKRARSSSVSRGPGRPQKPRDSPSSEDAEGELEE